nr:capsular biosynthesis protein [Rhodobacter calidifons]
MQRRIYSWQYNGTRALLEKRPEAVAVVWNGLNGTRRAFAEAARDAGVRTLFFELAPFRDRVTCDPRGVNFANSLPREIRPYLDWAARSGIAPDTWKAERARIRQRKPLRPAVAHNTASRAEGLTGPFLFAPLQVPGDSQLRLFGGAFRTVPDFIAALVSAADALPEGWHLRIKEHPSAEKSFAHLVRGARVVLDNDSDTFDLVARSAGVITVNSSVGLESMFFDRPVIACGQCFWAIPGVAEIAADPSAIARKFAEAPGLGFDPAARAAFLNFLLGEYYIATDNSDPARSDKIMARLEKAWP